MSYTVMQDYCVLILSAARCAKHEIASVCIREFIPNTHACLHDLVCFTASVKLSVKEIIKNKLWLITLFQIFVYWVWCLTVLFGVSFTPRFVELICQVFLHCHMLGRSCSGLCHCSKTQCVKIKIKTSKMPTFLSFSVFHEHLHYNDPNHKHNTCCCSSHTYTNSNSCIMFVLTETCY